MSSDDEGDDKEMDMMNDVLLMIGGELQTQAQAHGHLPELAWVFHLYFVMFLASTSLVGSFHCSNYPLPLR
jgi:hypothetical protein